MLETLTSVLIEEIANKGTFRLENVFSVSEHQVKNLRVPKLGTSEGGIIPETSRLRAKLSSTVLKLYKLQRSFPDNPGLVNRDSWRDALKWHDEGNRGPGFKPLTEEKRIEEKPANSFELINPFLDEDD